MSREIDEKIIDAFGYEIGHTDDWGYFVYLDHQDPTLFRPSENMQDAWRVVEDMMENGYNFYGIGHIESSNKYHCMFTAGAGMWDGFDESAPMAICKATLSCEGVKIDE